MNSFCDGLEKQFSKGELNGALTIINRLMSENRDHQYDHKELIGAINIIGDELRDDKVIGVQK